MEYSEAAHERHRLITADVTTVNYSSNLNLHISNPNHNPNPNNGLLNTRAYISHLRGQN